MKRTLDMILGIGAKLSSTRLLSAFLAALLGATLASSTAYAQATLVKTIDLGSWGGVPVSQSGFALPSPIVLTNAFTVQVPQPAPGTAFSLTGIAVDPVLNRVYVADHASTNVYLIDGATNTVSSAVYTYGFFGNIDGLPPSMGGIMGKAVTNVIANPSTGRWLTLGGYGGGQFSGTTFVEGVATQAMNNGGAWDPVTGNVYGASGYAFFTSQNVKFLNLAASTCNTVAFNSLTLRVYASCILGYSGGLANIPNNGLISWDGGDPSVQARIGTVAAPNATLALQHTAVQLAGIAVNANSNRVYVVGATSPTSLDVLDATTNAIVASIPGLPDQSGDIFVGAMGNAPLPRPIGINTRTNTIFVLNSVSSTVSVFDGRTNNLIGTISIPVPPGAVVNVPVPPNMFWEEVKTGNTYFSFANPVSGSVGTLTSLGGAVSLAVNEATNMLYVASVNGTVSVFALAPPAAPPAFSISGKIATPQGAPVAGITLSATGAAGNATAVTDAAGVFVLANLPLGTYTITPANPAFSFGPPFQTVSVIDRNVGGLAFQANPPIVPNSYTLSPWTMIGAGVTTTATVTLNQPAPSGGALLTLSASDLKSAKFPASVTVPGGQSSVTFQVQGNGVSATTMVTLTAQYNGGTASASLIVAPSDSLKVSAATFSTSTHVLTVNATGTNPQAILNVYLASNNQLLGTMVNQGGGNYTFQQPFLSGTPASVNVVSNLGGKTGQGVALVP